MTVTEMSLTVNHRRYVTPHSSLLFCSRLLVSSTWSCGLETSGSSSRRLASSLPSCGLLLLLRRNLLHQKPTASRERTNKTRTPATREDTSPTTASRDTTRWWAELLLINTLLFTPGDCTGTFWKESPQKGCNLMVWLGRGNKSCDVTRHLTPGPSWHAESVFRSNYNLKVSVYLEEWDYYTTDDSGHWGLSTCSECLVRTIISFIVDSEYPAVHHENLCITDGHWPSNI